MLNINRLKKTIEEKLDIDLTEIIDKSKNSFHDIKTNINDVAKKIKDELKKETLNKYLFYDSEEAYTLAIPVSGCSRKEIKITLNYGNLSISTTNDKFKYNYDIFIGDDVISKTKLKNGMLYLIINKTKSEIEL